MKKALARLALCMVDATKLFVRWMDGTCLEAAPIPSQLPYCLPGSYAHTEATHSMHRPSFRHEGAALCREEDATFLAGFLL